MSDRMRLMMSDRIVCVCGCHVVTGRCMWHSDGTHPWEKADVGRICHRCKMPVQAINIDQLIREVDGLLDGRTQAEGQRNDKEERSSA